MFIKCLLNVIIYLLNLYI